MAYTLNGLSPSYTQLSLTNTSNQIVLGSNKTTTINATPPTASRIYTIPDSGANASFVMTQGAQTITGVKTHATPGQIFQTGSSSTVALIVQPSTGSSRRAEIDIDNWCWIQDLSNNQIKNFGVYNTATGHSPLVFNTNDSLQFYSWYCSRPSVSISSTTTLDNTYSNVPIILSTNAAADYNINLPAAASNPYCFEFVVSTFSNAHNIIIQTTGSGAELSLFGIVFQNNVSTKLSANSKLQLNQAAMTRGDWIRIKGNALTWMVECYMSQAASITIT